MSVKNFHIHARKVEQMHGTNSSGYYIPPKSGIRLSGVSAPLYRVTQDGFRSSLCFMGLLLLVSQRSSVSLRNSSRVMLLPLKRELSRVATARLQLSLSPRTRLYRFSMMVTCRRLKTTPD